MSKYCSECGKSYRVIIQPVGSGGPIDPLDQYGKYDINDPRFCHCVPRDLAPDEKKLCEACGKHYALKYSRYCRYHKGSCRECDVRDPHVHFHQDLNEIKIGTNVRAEASMKEHSLRLQIENLHGLIRRLEKSNEELGLQLHKCMHPEGPEGWD